MAGALGGVILGFIVSIVLGRRIFRWLYDKQKGHTVTRYYTAGSFSCAFILTWGIWVVPALFLGQGPGPSYEANLVRSVILFVLWSAVFTSVGFGFGKLKERFGQ